MSLARRVSLILSLLALTTLCQAQSWRDHFSGSASFVSTYVYRGLKLGNPSAFVILNYNLGGFTATAETGMAFNGHYMETMLSVGYSIKDFKLEVRDQFFPIYDDVVAYSYFNWNPKETSHQVEALLTYAPKKLPLKVQWSTYFAGYDLKYCYDENGDFHWGNRAFSSYLELTGFHKFPYMQTVAATVGASMNKGLYTDYQKDFAVVNLRLAYLKTWVWKGVYPTAGAYVVYNPYADKVYPIVYLSLGF